MKHSKVKYIGYYRCSTVEQGKSGLGLLGQKTVVKNYVKGHGELIAEFVEVETGTNKKIRTEITKALTMAKKEKAILVIAKLDRLARNVNFVSSLMESGVEFIACDMPTANNFTIHIFAAFAEQEAKLISERTKSALAELKAIGKSLGSPLNLTKEAREKGTLKRIENAQNNSNNIKGRAMAKLLKEKGMNFLQISRKLNNLGYYTRRNSQYRAETVKRLLIA
jgi:DNA invertase Pin-like site-specific DNA recombinase